MRGFAEIEGLRRSGTRRLLAANSRVAEVIQHALLHFDGERYRLLAWVICPITPCGIEGVCPAFPWHEGRELLEGVWCQGEDCQVDWRLFGWETKVRRAIRPRPGGISGPHGNAWHDGREPRKGGFGALCEGVAVDGRLFAGIRMRARRPRSRGTTNKRRRSMRNRSSLPYRSTWANWERTLLRNRARSLERSII